MKTMSSLNNDAIKTCCRCHLDFPASEEFFSPRVKTKDGLRKRCKNCSGHDSVTAPLREKDGLHRCVGCKKHLPTDSFVVRNGTPYTFCRDCTFRKRENEKKEGLTRQSVCRWQDGQKECSDCDQFKEVAQFYMVKTGLSSYCKEYYRSRSKRNREKHKENGEACKSRVKYSPEELKQRHKESVERWSQKRTEANKNNAVATEKVCPRCEQLIPAALFKKRPYNVDGLATACSRCEYKGAKKSEAVRKTDRWWVYMYAAISRRAKDKGEESDITKEFLKELFEKQNGLCYWFGIPLVPTAENRHPQKPSLDRVDGSKGYTQDNVVLACHAANMGRNSSTFQQFTDFVAVLKSSFGQDV